MKNQRPINRGVEFDPLTSTHYTPNPKSGRIFGAFITGKKKLTDGIDVAPVGFDLRMLQGITVNLTGAC